MNATHAVRKNFEEKASYVAKLAPGMSVIDSGSFLVVDSGIPSDTFNVIVVRDLSDPSQLLKNGVTHFLHKQLPMAIWYWEDANASGNTDALLAYGLTSTETDVAMIADLTQTNLQVAQPEGLTIKMVEHVDELQQFAAVLVRLFGTSDEAQGVAAYFQRLSQFAPDQFPAMRYYIGIYQNQVVATGTLFVGSETCGIYDIVTDDAFRRKGIGSAMFGELLHQATGFGHRYAVLQASPDGLAIYARAGFEAVGSVRVFENRSLLIERKP